MSGDMRMYYKHLKYRKRYLDQCRISGGASRLRPPSDQYHNQLPRIHNQRNVHCTCECSRPEVGIDNPPLPHIHCTCECGRPGVGEETLPPRLEPPPPAPTVVISADYDGCWDIQGGQMDVYFPATAGDVSERAERVEQLQLVRKQFYDMINTITRDHETATLMVGSARQSNSTDLDMRAGSQIRMMVRFPPNQGFCFLDYANLVEHIPDELDQAVRWSFDRLLVADADEARRQDIPLEFPVDQPTAWNDDNITLSPRGGDYAIKLDLLRLQFQQIITKRDRARQGGDIPPTDFYFIDDRDDILRTIATELDRGRLEVPDGIRFHLVQFDWFAIFEGNNPVKNPYL